MTLVGFLPWSKVSIALLSACATPAALLDGRETTACAFVHSAVASVAFAHRANAGSCSRRATTVAGVEGTRGAREPSGAIPGLKAVARGTGAVAATDLSFPGNERPPPDADVRPGRRPSAESNERRGEAPEPVDLPRGGVLPSGRRPAFGNPLLAAHHRVAPSVVLAPPPLEALVLDDARRDAAQKDGRQRPSLSRRLSQSRRRAFRGTSLPPSCSKVLSPSSTSGVRLLPASSSVADASAPPPSASVTIICSGVSSAASRPQLPLAFAFRMSASFLSFPNTRVRHAPSSSIPAAIVQNLFHMSPSINLVSPTPVPPPLVPRVPLAPPATPSFVPPSDMATDLAGPPGGRRHFRSPASDPRSRRVHVLSPGLACATISPAGPRQLSFRSPLRAIYTRTLLHFTHSPHATAPTPSYANTAAATDQLQRAERELICLPYLE